MGTAITTGFYAEAFLWSNGQVINLGKPRNATNSNANAISDTGIICGHYTIADPMGAGGYKPRALAWIDGKMIDLGVLSGYLNSRAFDVNDAGDIVGYCNNPPLLGNGVRAFLWRDGVMIALDDLRAPDSLQYQIWLAYGINNNGQIAAQVKPPTGSAMAALVTPVPPRAGDTNCDWLVNVSDLLTVINNWGPAPPEVAFQGSPDLNHDGVVNVSDLLAVINDWG
jgi:probable HAF family extracellular repeat protein